MKAVVLLLLAGLAALVAAFAIRGDGRLSAYGNQLIGYGFGLYSHEPAPQPDPASGVMERAAVHYDLVCAACHASPARPTQGDHLLFHPAAPRLHQRLNHWPAALIHAVVRDGLPHSAMPRWPAPRRSDEIRAMVRFLQELPQLDAEGYRQLARAETTGTRADAPDATCRRCHDGKGRAAPVLGLQTEAYLRDALRAFRSGTRASGYMQIVVAPLTDAAIEDLARAYSRSLPEPEAARPTAPPPDLVLRGDPGRKIAACIGCHGPTRPARFPALAGQNANYLATQLHLFANPALHRGGGPFRQLMERAAIGLTQEEVTALATWYAAQPPDPRGE